MSFAAIVAQIFNLLYRGLAVCQRQSISPSLAFRTPADCKSAIQQIENLRYEAARFLAG